MPSSQPKGAAPFTSDLSALSGRSSVVLGTTPASLRAFIRDGETHVFATGDRPTVVHADGGPTLLYTSVNLPYAALSTELTPDTAIRTRLNAARFTGSILAGLSGLIVASVVLTDGGGGYLAMGRITGSIATATTR